MLVAVLGILAGTVLALTGAPLALRALGAVALAFVLPGGALLLALMPHARLSRAERVAVMLGGSLVATVGTAFALHVLPPGMSALSWGVALGALTATGGVVGALRALRARAGEAATMEIATAGAGRGSVAVAAAGGWVAGAPVAGPRLRMVAPVTLVMLATAVVLVALSLVIARSGMALGPTARFTELWLLPLDGRSAVRVGVANHEGDSQVYRLQVTVDGLPVAAESRVTLPDGGATDAIVVLPDRRGKARTRVVEARLWHADQPVDAPPDRLVRAYLAAEPRAAP